MLKLIKREDKIVLLNLIRNCTIELLSADNISYIFKNHKLFLIAEEKKRTTVYYIDNVYTIENDYFISREKKINEVISVENKKHNNYYNINYNLSFYIPEEEDQDIFLIEEEDFIKFIYDYKGNPIFSYQGELKKIYYFNVPLVCIQKNQTFEIYSLEDGNPLFKTDCDINLFRFYNNIILEVKKKEKIKMLFTYNSVLKRFIPKMETKGSEEILRKGDDFTISYKNSGKSNDIITFE